MHLCTSRKRGCIVSREFSYRFSIIAETPRVPSTGSSPRAGARHGRTGACRIHPRAIQTIQVEVPCVLSAVVASSCLSCSGARVTRRKGIQNRPARPLFVAGRPRWARPRRRHIGIGGRQPSQTATSERILLPLRVHLLAFGISLGLVTGQ